MIDAGLVGVGEFLPAALVDTLGGHAGGNGVEATEMRGSRAE